MEMKRCVWVVMVFLVVFYDNAKAQQDPLYSMSALQPLVVNPAAIGTRGKSEASVQARNQWSGAANAKTIFAQYNGSYYNGQLATGMSFLSDRYGAFNRSMLSAVQAYQIQAYGFKISVALNANIEEYTFGIAQLSHSMSNEVDQALLINGKQTIVNFGASAYVFSDRFWVGFSMPHLVRQNFRKVDDPNFQPAYQTVNTVINAGGVAQLNEQWDYKPYFSLQFAQNVVPQLEIGTIAYWKKQIGGGVSYRFNDAVIVMMEYKVSDAFRFGYSYDITVSPLRAYVRGAHEILLKYHFGGYQGLR
jgi:type IX secretion system PorP/SprF family membrane protein